MRKLLMVGWMAGLFVGGTVAGAQQAVDLPTSKVLMVPAPGGPQKVNSLPLSLAVSPDGMWVVSLNAGYGTAESQYMQSLAVLNTSTGKITDFPDERVGERARQSFFSGLAFSADGTKVYASLASTTDPDGGPEVRGQVATGNGIVVYSFANGVLKPQRFLKLPMVKLAAERHTDYWPAGDGKTAIPYPAAIAVVGGKLLVAENLSDSAVLMDATTGAIEKTFDLSQSDAVPGTYPVGVAVTKDGRRAFVALWNASEIVELDLAKGTVERHLELLKPKSPTAAGTHPCAMVLDEKEGLLYVALANRDAVAAVEIGKGELAVKGYFDTRLPGQSYFGAEPDGLALSADGKRLYAANMGSDAVAVLDTKKLKSADKAKGMLEPLGFVPTELMPLALVSSGGKLYVSTDKGKGTGPNNMPQRPLPGDKNGRHGTSTFTYAPTMLYGSLAVLDEAKVEAGLKASTEEVLASNRMKAGEQRIAFAMGEAGPSATPQDDNAKTKAGPSATPQDDNAKTIAGPSATPQDDNAKTKAGPSATPQDDNAGANADSSAALRNDKEGGLRNDKRATPQDDNGRVLAGPIKHVIYIIKENRTYDQIFGDLEKDGKRVGNGDPSLTMYGEAVTPNEHKLVLQYGVLDNFYDSAEVSGDGHVWSNAAIGTDYLERTWQSNYRGRQRTYDYEGMVADGYPIRQNIPDVEEPQSGYIWGDMVAHGRTTYNFGEYISTVFCGDKRAPVTADPKAGAMNETEKPCDPNAIKPGEALPAVWGGGKNLWPWPIPRIADNIPTKPELVGHFAVESPDFNLRVPDVVRAQVFLRHLEQWKADRAAGKDTMPDFVEMRLGNDHTAGTVPGGPTPKSSVADNDLAIGMLVDAVSHSAYWNDTAFFILEDDAQNGADHVDAHRSLGIVVSKYAPHPKDGRAAFVDSSFYTTVSFLRTMEMLLGVPPMNNNDALAPPVASLFTGPGDQPAYTADVSNKTNGLIYMANPAKAKGAEASMKMDFTHPDRADPVKLNLVLWQDAKGDQPPPAMLLVKHKAKKDDDD